MGRFPTLRWVQDRRGNTLLGMPMRFSDSSFENGCPGTTRSAHCSHPCAGGPPCGYCISKKQQCVPQAVQPKASVVFVNVTAASKRTDCLSPPTHLPRLRLCPKILEGISAIFAKHFFSDFVARNDFGGPLDLGSIMSGFQRSPSMYHASIALGALDLSRKTLLAIPLERKDAAVGAITAYHTSISELKIEIVSNSVPPDVNLWTTFFLGLFELMHDMTGEGWVKHFLYGTSNMLRLRGPEAHLSGSGRVWDLLKPDSNHPSMLLHKTLLELAAEGFIVRSALHDWYATFQKWSADTGTPAHNPQSILATIYFHSISIYLSGIFDYRAQFNGIPTPTISPAVVQNHVDAILWMAEIALKTTALASVLFFFPLRVAGARVTAAAETESIHAMFRDISARGFVVADAFTADLRSLWRRKGI
ncbi:hypothetical protein KXX32_008714 [Aspergillus fumigatus]|nr:hypothetical protein KXX32_008714 [Aspergillus fumigatus]